MKREERDYSKIIGWYDQPDQNEPSHDPGRSAPCPVCGEPLVEPARYISIMPMDRRIRSYFYGMHPACTDDPATNETISHEVMDWIEAAETNVAKRTIRPPSPPSKEMKNE